MVSGVDGHENHDASEKGIEYRPCAARDYAQGRVEEGVSWGNVDGGSEILHDVLGGIEHHDFEEQFGYDDGDGRGPGAHAWERLV